MNTSMLLENSTQLSLSENWERSCAAWIERPLSAISWGMTEMTGESMLDELPELQIYPQELCFMN